MSAFSPEISSAVGNNREARRLLLADLGLLVVRLVVGGFTLLAAVQILVSDADFGTYVARTGVPFPGVVASLVLAGHLGLGVLLILGFLTPLTGVLLAIKFLLIFLGYYVVGPDSALTLTAVGTLAGVESLSYGMSGVLIAYAGGGILTVDRLVGWLRAGRTGGVDLSDSPPRRIGYAVFRCYLGGLVLVHGIRLVQGEPGPSLKALASGLNGIGLGTSALVRWVVVAVLLGSGLLLVSARLIRVAGAVLLGLAFTLLLSLPNVGGTSVEGYGFHGEEYLFIAAASVLLISSGRRSKRQSVTDGLPTRREQPQSDGFR